MASYKTIITLRFLHEYFAAATWQGLGCVPTATTRKRMDAAGFLAHWSRGNMVLQWDVERDRHVRVVAEETAGSLEFCFVFTATDRSFANFSDWPSLNEEEIPMVQISRDQLSARFDGECGTNESGLREFGHLTSGERLIGADFILIVRLRIMDDLHGSAIIGEVRCGAIRPYWKYHLLGGINRDGLGIVDLDGVVEFEPCGLAPVFDGRAALVFRSRSTLEIRENSPFRFQLRERSGAGRVLIKRLPVVAPKWSIEMVEGQLAPVASAFVNY